MNNNDIKTAINIKEERRRQKLAAREAKLTAKINKELLTPSRVDVNQVEDSHRLTITPPPYKRYFTSFLMQSFWVTLIICSPVIIPGTFFIRSLLKGVIGDTIATTFVAAFLSADVILILFTFIVLTFRSEFHVQIMENNYAILRGKGLRLKASGEKNQLGYEIKKYYSNGWSRLEIKNYRTRWGFEYLNYDDVDKVKLFYRDHIH